MFIRNISTLELDKTVVVGVYMRFDDQSLENRIEHENDTNYIGEIINKFDSKRVVAIGEFNTDLNRKKKFGKILQNMINENNLLVLDLM